MIYKIKSVHFLDADSIYVSAGYSNMVMQYLIAYIQFAFYKIAPDYGLSPLQIGSILINVYEFDASEPNDESTVIDMFDIWEDYCMAANIILNIRLFQNEKLHNELVKQLHYITYEYETLHSQQIVCHICDSDAAIYFTGTAEQCLQYLQEQDEMFAQLPQVMILTEEKYMTMFGYG